MSEQPEALFLAGELEAPLGTVISGEVDRRAAIELRRLHAVNQELLEALKKLEEAARCVQVGEWDRASIDVERREARAAIARAEGQA